MASPEKARKLRCAIYTRKSTDEGLDMEFNTLDAQRTGTYGQVWWPLCTEEQVRQVTDEKWGSMRPASWSPAAI